MAEADREADEREARTLTVKEEMALRRLMSAKTNALEAQLCNGVADDSPLAGSLRGEITEARERLPASARAWCSPYRRQKEYA